MTTTQASAPDGSVDYSTLGQKAVTEFCLYLHIYWLNQDFSEFLSEPDAPLPRPPAALDAPSRRDMTALERYLGVSPGTLAYFDTLAPALPVSECRHWIEQYCERSGVHFTAISTFARHYYPLIEFSDCVWQSRATATADTIGVMRFSPQDRGSRQLNDKGLFAIQQPESISLFEPCDILVWLDPKVVSHYTEALKRWAALTAVVKLGDGAKVTPFCQALEWHDESGLEGQPTDGNRPLRWRWRVSPTEGSVGKHTVRYALSVYTQSANTELPWRIAHLADVPLTITANSWYDWLTNQYRLGERRLPWVKFVVAALGLIGVVMLIILRGQELLGFLLGR
ncbi:hypothetical protein Q9252_15400 [Marinobacter salarius]|uniref:hypothetical protein n=1 Tax=Marinobacter salarius TaxID=1420917 RepID=UPI00273C4414|nr:hypothetical protein [Marinobacter salarius]MDP4533530.1 hypothetical protein [Marinobacter salarius]